MAVTATLLQLRNRARLYADMRADTESDAFINGSELTDLINAEIQAIYDDLVAARGHEYYQSTDAISVVSGTSSYALPSDFYQAQKLVLEWSSSDHEIVQDFQLDEEPELTVLSVWGRGMPKGARIVGSNIQIKPDPTSAVTARLYYVPAFTKLSDDADTFDGVNGWEEAAVLGAAVRMRMIARRDYEDLQKAKEEVLVRIRRMAADRAANWPKRVRDVNPHQYRRRGWRLPWGSA